MDIAHQIAEALKRHIYPKDAPIPDWYLDATAKHIKETCHQILVKGDGHRENWNPQGSSLVKLLQRVNAELAKVAAWEKRSDRKDLRFPMPDFTNDDFMYQLSNSFFYAVIEYHVAEVHAETILDLDSTYPYHDFFSKLFDKLRDEVLQEYTTAQKLEPINFEVYYRY